MGIFSPEVKTLYHLHPTLCDECGAQEICDTNEEIFQSVFSLLKSPSTCESCCSEPGPGELSPASNVGDDVILDSDDVINQRSDAYRFNLDSSKAEEVCDLITEGLGSGENGMESTREGVEYERGGEVEGDLDTEGEGERRGEGGGDLREQVDIGKTDNVSGQLLFYQMPSSSKGTQSLHCQISSGGCTTDNTSSIVLSPSGIGDNTALEYVNAEPNIITQLSPAAFKIPCVSEVYSESDENVEIASIRQQDPYIEHTELTGYDREFSDVLGVQNVLFDIEYDPESFEPESYVMQDSSVEDGASKV